MEDSSPKPMTKFRLRFLIASVFCFYFTSLSAQQWQSLGPFKPGIPNGTDKGISRASGIGRVSCIRPDTNDSLLLFCGSPYGALYKSADGGNVLTTKVLSELPNHAGKKVIYGTACRIGAERLRKEGITFKQLPYKLRIGEK